MSISTVSEAKAQIASYVENHGAFPNPHPIKTDEGFLLVGLNNSNALTDGSACFVPKSETDTYNACCIVANQ